MKNPFQKAKAPQPDTTAPALDAPPDPLVVDEPVEDALIVTLTDEGVPYDALDEITIVNRSADAYDARHLSLHLTGRTFTHVSDTVDGAWVYRLDP